MTEPDKEEVIRLNVEVPKSLNDRLRNRIPWGLKADLIRKLVSMFADIIEREGLDVIIALHEDRLEFRYKSVDPSRVDSENDDAS